MKGRLWIRMGERRIFGPLLSLVILWLGLGLLLGRVWVALLTLATVWALWQSWKDVNGGQR